jgi:hypothetical protein
MRPKSYTLSITTLPIIAEDALVIPKPLPQYIVSVWIQNRILILFGFFLKPAHSKNKPEFHPNFVSIQD